MTGKNTSATLRALIETRVGRRELLASSGIWLGGGLRELVFAQPAESGAGLPSVEPSSADTVIVPAGYRADVVLRWGDPLSGAGPGLDVASLARGSLFAEGAAAAQARAFGTHCDGVGVLPLAADRLLMCVNHESVTPATMFPGWNAARDAGGRGPFLARRPEAVRVMQAAVGVSVVELAYREDRWQPVRDSRWNRRITATTPVSFSGPAAAHPWLVGPDRRGPASGRGTFGNCAAGMTPWGTYLTAEENVDDFFGRGARADFDPDVAAAHRRFGFRRRDSAYRWEYVDSRFDLERNPLEPFRFGWIVEIDPRRPEAAVRKRTALGRFKHESATTVLTSESRPVVYMGDDQVFEYLYKFVADARYDPGRPDPDILDRGTLYVARLHEDGRGEWLPLVWSAGPGLGAEDGFRDQGDLLVRCREAADRLGATPLDRPEDIAVNPVTGRIYLSCTQNLNRGNPDGYRGRSVDVAVDGANPRPGNRYGHILEFEEDADFDSLGFRWNVFVLAGDPASGRLHTAAPPPPGTPGEDTYFAGRGAAARPSAFANPDNLGFDSRGNLWIVTDGVQPLGNNNGCFVCPTAGPGRGLVTQFMSGPAGAEICGCEFAPDGRTLFLTVQHPGSGGSVERPVSDWPDGRGQPPRSSLIAVTPGDPKRAFGT